MSAESHVRYYDARRTRRWVVSLVVLVVVGAVGIGLAIVRNPVDDAPLVVAPTSVVEPVSSPPPPVSTTMVPSAPEPIEFESVLIVGDSITRGSRDALRFALAGAGVTDLEIDGEDSRRIAVGNGRSEPLAGRRAIEGHLREGADPEAWVVALGTNDVGLYEGADEYRELVRAILELVPSDAALLWVDVYRYDDLAATATFNDVVRDELADRDRAGVASWFDVVSADESLLQADRLHPDDNGRAAFARLVASGLASLTQTDTAPAG